MSRHTSSATRKFVSSWDKWVFGMRLTAREYRAVKRWQERANRISRLQTRRARALAEGKRKAETND